MMCVNAIRTSGLYTGVWILLDVVLVLPGNGLAIGLELALAVLNLGLALFVARTVRHRRLRSQRVLLGFCVWLGLGIAFSLYKITGYSYRSCIGCTATRSYLSLTAFGLACSPEKKKNSLPLTRTLSRRHQCGRVLADLGFGYLDHHHSPPLARFAIC
jgi:hypothetical protein